MLPSKFETRGARTQNLPKRALGRRHHTPQPARSRDRPSFRFRRHVSQHLPSPSSLLPIFPLPSPPSLFISSFSSLSLPPPSSPLLLPSLSHLPLPLLSPSPFFSLLLPPPP